MGHSNEVWTFADAKAAVLRALRSTSIQTVTIDYYGESDDGQIEDISVDIAHAAELDAMVAVDLYSDGQPAQRLLRDVLDDFTWQVLDFCQSGYEINDGGHGIITIDVAKGTVTVNHNAHVTEFVPSTTEV